MPGFGMKTRRAGKRSVAAVPQIRGQLVEQPVNPVLLDVGDGGPVDAGRAAVGAHLLPRPLQDVPAMDLVVERVEPSPGIGLGRPVQRSLQFSDFVLLGGPSHVGTHQPFPARDARDEAAALPSPAVVLSRRLKRYYGRLRRPPGTPPTSRLTPVIGRDAPTARSAGRRAGEGLPSSRRHLLNVPRPIRRGVPRGCTSRLFTPSMAFTLTTGLGSSSSTKAGTLTTRQASLDAADRSVAPPTRAFDAGLRPGRFPPSRQPATGPPGSYPDRTHTGRRRRACRWITIITSSTSNRLGAPRSS